MSGIIDKISKMDYVVPQYFFVVSVGEFEPLHFDRIVFSLEVFSDSNKAIAHAAKLANEDKEQYGPERTDSHSDFTNWWNIEGKMPFIAIEKKCLNMTDNAE